MAITNISGFGLQVNVVASNTFPNGVVISAFADDADPFDVAELKVTDSAMGLNGDFIAWNKANAVEITLNVIPRSPDDVNLSQLLDANRVAKGKASSKDEITLVGMYPDGKQVTLSGGVIDSGAITAEVASAGRLKSRLYRFRFAAKVGTGT